uniref:Uncharacterized protein n=1 Tax=Heliothis virescens TaxID=7102 RepID=A0A2A4IZ01_HELVI
MELRRVIVTLICTVIVNAKVIKVDEDGDEDVINEDIKAPDDNFNGVYAECFLHMSFPCVQRKTLMYLKQLNNLSEVSVIGDYVKFVKLNTSKVEENKDIEENLSENNSEELTHMIDRAIDNFFDNHIIRFSALGRETSLPITNNEEFVGRKKPMMGMMGMMSFKGMMFSMMSFMLAKGWATGGGGGGAWMPAGGPDYGGGGGGGGGGYDANGQWQSRSILDLGEKEEIIESKPIISYVAPVVRYKNKNVEKNKDDVIKVKSNGNTVKSRRKRSIIDVLQNSYIYWMNKLLGINSNRRTSNNYPKYKIVNGVKYVFYPYPQQKVKLPKEIQSNRIKTVDEGFKPIITAEDFNKGEIVEGAVESRMNRKKMNKMKETVNETLDDNPWE